MTSGKGVFANALKVELKLVKKADSLVGTAYYYMNTNNYIRYSVKGYLDNRDNAVHWWDDKLLGVKPAGTKTVILFDKSMTSDAAFNCPNPNVMKLDGTSHIGDDGPEFVLHFDKTVKPLFPDEWDNVIEGYFSGMSDPDTIDSVFAITKEYKPVVPEVVVAKADVPEDEKKDKDALASTTGLSTPSGNNTIAKNEKPIEKPVALPSSIVTPIEKQTSPPIAGDTVTSGTALIPKRTTQDAKPVAKTTPALKQEDSAVIAKQKPVTDTGKKVPQEVAKTNLSVTKPDSEIAGTVLKKTEQDLTKAQPPVVKQTVPAAGYTKAATTPTVLKPAVDSQAIAKSTTPDEEERITGTVRKTASKAPSIVIKPITVPERVDPVAIQKFVTRKKINQGEIPMVGDSVELNFYDNAEIDGDSISLFLNGKLLFNHVLLSAQAYTFKLATKDLPTGSELTMVAENLGSIPPNTAYMMAVVDGQRYSARLESTEQSSGVIKLVRKTPQ